MKYRYRLTLHGIKADEPDQATTEQFSYIIKSASDQEAIDCWENHIKLLFRVVHRPELVGVGRRGWQQARHRKGRSMEQHPVNYSPPPPPADPRLRGRR